MAIGGSQKTPNPRRRFHLQQLEQRRSRFKNRFRSSKRKLFETSAFQSIMVLTKRVLVLLTLAIIIIGGVYLVSFSSFFKISAIQYFKDDSAADRVIFESVVDPFHGRNLIFLKARELENDILQTFPTTIQSVEVDKKYPATLKISYVNFPLLLNIRAESKVGNETIQKKFVINSEGYVVEENIEYPNLPFMFTAVDVFPVLGAQFFSAEVTSKIASASESFLTIFGMKIKQITYKKAAREIHLKTERDFTIWLDITQSIEKQFAKLKRALPKIDIYREPLDYIDLRISGKDSERVIYSKK